MFRRFLNTRVPSILCALAFIACCMMFCRALFHIRETAEVTTALLKELVVWGTLALAMMLAFCVCLATVTRYRRGLPGEQVVFRHTMR